MSQHSSPEKQNVGSRIEKFVLRTRQNNQDKTAIDALAFGLGIADEVQGLDRQHMTADLVTAVITELRAMKASLIAMGIPSDLVSPYTSNAEQALAVGNFNNSWKTTISNYLNADVLLALKWYAYVLPEDAITTTPEEVAELSDLLTELEQAASRPGIPESLVQFIQKQIASIRLAVQLCPVAGTRPIRDAARAMAFAIHLDDDEIRTNFQHCDPSVAADLGSKLKKTWDKAAQIAGDIDKFGKAGKAALEVGKFLYTLLPSSAGPG